MMRCVPVVCSMLMIVTPASALKQYDQPKQELQPEQKKSEQNKTDFFLVPHALVERFRPKEARNFFHLIPTNSYFCYEGTEDYLKEALARLQASNLQTGWMTSKIEPGTCDSATYWEGPFEENCFTGATAWFTMDHPSMDLSNPESPLSTMNKNFFEEYYSTRMETAKSQHDVQCLGKPTFHMLSKHASLCYQAHSEEDLKDTLERLQESNLKLGWEKTKIESGSCASGRHPVGPHTDGCFPNVAAWFNSFQKQVNLRDPAILFATFYNIHNENIKEFNEAHPELNPSLVPIADCSKKMLKKQAALYLY